MAKLFETYQLKNMELKNRIVMAPMCMYMADNMDGFANDFHEIHYATRAIGGVGLIILEATGVEPRGRISDKDLGIWKDKHMDGLKKIVAHCHRYGAKVGIQLAHAGRKSEVLSIPSIAPSPIAFSEAYRVPLEMTIEDIKEVVNAFKEGARRANEAGFDIIELHGAHGYLISEFLSPLTNHRTDQYGGSEENRARFLKDILQEITNVWPKEKPIQIRLSCEDYKEGGNHDTDLARILNSLKSEGIDIVDVSSGAIVNVPMKTYPGYQLKYAETMKKETGLPVIAGGLVTSPLMAEEILQNDRADFVFLGRELLRNPYWALSAAKTLGVDLEWPTPYVRGK